MNSLEIIKTRKGKSVPKWIVQNKETKEEFKLEGWLKKGDDWKVVLVGDTSKLCLLETFVQNYYKVGTYE